MVYNSGAQVEGQGMRLQQQKNGSMSDKQKNRPKSLQLNPFDAGELTRRLSVVVAEQDDDNVDSMAPLKSSKESPMNYSYHLKGRAASVATSSASPRTIPGKQPSPKDKGFSPKLHMRKYSTSEAAPRRGSIFDRFSWKGSNYDEKEEQATQATTAPAYRHVPRVAAAQFARTTTVETVSQKAQVVKSTKPAPGPGAMSNATMSAGDYNKAYRRAQSLCSGRPYNGSNGFQLTVLETTAEVDEDAQQPQRSSFQGHWTKGFDVGPEPSLGRRMSTGNMFAKADNRLPVEMPSFQRRDSTVRRDSHSTSSSFRRDSGGSTPFRDPGNLSPYRRDSDKDSSAPLSPFRQEFEGLTHIRRESEAGIASRRGSYAAMVEMHRADWSQSDNGSKNSGSNLLRVESKWNLRGRLSSISKHGKEGDEENLPPMSPRSPKSGFLSKFKRQQ
ncbi:Fc.00g017300.m01.CDS01 [Cosmosporella sp. VM-42]